MQQKEFLQPAQNVPGPQEHWSEEFSAPSTPRRVKMQLMPYFAHFFQNSAETLREDSATQTRRQLIRRQVVRHHRARRRSPMLVNRQKTQMTKILM